MEHLIIPVVWNVVVLTVIVSEGSVRIELEVVTYKVLSLRECVNEVTETAVVLIEEVFVGISISFCNGRT